MHVGAGLVDGPRNSDGFSRRACGTRSTAGGFSREDGVGHATAVLIEHDIFNRADGLAARVFYGGSNDFTRWHVFSGRSRTRRRRRLGVGGSDNGEARDGQCCYA